MKHNSTCQYLQLFASSGIVNFNFQKHYKKFLKRHFIKVDYNWDKMQGPYTDTELQDSGG